MTLSQFGCLLLLRVCIIGMMVAKRLIFGTLRQYNPVVKSIFWGQRGFGIPTKFFFADYISMMVADSESVWCQLGTLGQIA